VLTPFARLSDARFAPVVLDVSTPNSDDPPANPGHPACAEHADSDYCRESWQLHLAELSRRPRSHWHRCDKDRLCAIVPIVTRGRCVAAVKIACRASMAEEDFARQVEILDLLAREFADKHDQALAPFVPASAPASRSQEEYRERTPTHPRILRAIRAIEAQLADPGLTVWRIAREMGIDPSYLGHLFVEQVGQRMSRFIALRRMELARKLLATTDWQIKRIAHETGHANPNWFCYVFRAVTGQTPGGYRKRAHDHPSRQS
jgi:AraC-like DNA-binding protein